MVHDNLQVHLLFLAEPTHFPDILKVVFELVIEYLEPGR